MFWLCRLLRGHRPRPGGSRGTPEAFVGSYYGRIKITTTVHAQRTTSRTWRRKRSSKRAALFWSSIQSPIGESFSSKSDSVQSKDHKSCACEGREGLSRLFPSDRISFGKWEVPSLNPILSGRWS